MSYISQSDTLTHRCTGSEDHSISKKRFCRNSNIPGRRTAAYRCDLTDDPWRTGCLPLPVQVVYSKEGRSIKNKKL